MDSSNNRTQYQLVLALLIYSGILVPLFAVVCGSGMSFVKSLWFLVPVVSLYGLAAIWMAIKFKFHLVFKVLWLLAVAVFLAYIVGSMTINIA